jgi:hypothetical protein
MCQFHDIKGGWQLGKNQLINDDHLAHLWRKLELMKQDAAQFSGPSW